MQTMSKIKMLVGSHRRGAIEYDTLLLLSMPHIDELNARYKTIAKKHRKRPRVVALRDFM